MTADYWNEVFSSNPNYMRNGLEGLDHPSRTWSRDFLVNGNYGSVLDVGCGNGIELSSLRAKGSGIAYSGCDYSPEAVEAAKSMFPNMDPNDGTFFVADARELRNVPDASYDVVMLRHTLEHVNRWQEALGAAWRVARKAVLVVMWIEPVAAETVIRDKGGDAWYVKFREEDLIDMFAALGARSWKKTVIRDGVKEKPHRVDTCYEVIKNS